MALARQGEMKTPTPGDTKISLPTAFRCFPESIHQNSRAPLSSLSLRETETPFAGHSEPRH